jgi:2-polyprenylphenol hydroxylase and related flavodoxin oxidoreductases
MRARITDNRPVAEGVWRMGFSGDTAGFTPGSFLNLTVPGFYLRRPFAIADYDENMFSIYYKVVGGGTESMTSLTVGTEADILAPLGRGFTENDCAAPLLVGGGAGVAPLYALAKHLRKDGKAVTVALGFTSTGDAYLTDEFAALGCTVLLASVDGTLGAKGFVTRLLGDVSADYFYTCGPTPMLQAVCAALAISGEVSLEERMACGFGACVGCAVKTVSGMKRVCKDGPVFSKEEVLWA